MILVAMGNHKGFDLVELVFDVREIGKDEIHTRFSGRREQDTTVDNQQPAAVLENGHVSTNFGNTTEGDDTKTVLRGLRRLGKSLREVCTLHGLDNIATGTAIAVAITVATRVGGTLIVAAARFAVAGSVGIATSAAGATVTAVRRALAVAARATTLSAFSFTVVRAGRLLGAFRG